MAEAISKLLNTDGAQAGTVLRVGLMVHGDEPKVVRTSVYDRTTHILTIALDDHDQFVPAYEPEPNPELLTAFDDTPPPVRTRGDLPSVYDGIYQAAYSYGMSAPMTKQLIRLLASDVDFQARLNPTDRLEVFFSQPDGDDQMSDDSELLYVSATFGGTTRNFYRFRCSDGSIDYFDEEGRSAEQFLLRNPVPNGRFRSGFGMRAPSDPRLCQDAHRRRLGRADRHADHRRRQRRHREGRLGRRLRQARPSSATPTATRPPTITRAPSPKASSRACKVRQGQVIGYLGPDRPLDRPASPLRADRQRHQGRPDARSPAGRQGAEGRRPGRLQAGARAHRPAAEGGRWLR